MRTPVKIVVGVAALAGLGVGGFSGFEYFDHRGVIKTSERACGTLDTPTGSPVLPSTLTLPTKEKLLSVTTQGKTTLVIASVPGTRAEVVKIRDAVVNELATQGFTKKGSDQEPGYEAEAQLTGKADASLRVRPLCSGRIELRYTVRG